MFDKLGGVDQIFELCMSFDHLKLLGAIYLALKRADDCAPTPTFPIILEPGMNWVNNLVNVSFVRKLFIISMLYYE